MGVARVRFEDTLCAFHEPCMIMQVSEVVAEVLGHNVPSPSAESGKATSPGPANVRTHASGSSRGIGRKGIVRMQLRTELLSRPRKTWVVYKREDTVSKEEAYLHGGT